MLLGSCPSHLHKKSFCLSITFDFYHLANHLDLTLLEAISCERFPTKCEVQSLEIICLLSILIHKGLHHHDVSKQCNVDRVELGNPMQLGDKLSSNVQKLNLDHNVFNSFPLAGIHPRRIRMRSESRIHACLLHECIQGLGCDVGMPKFSSVQVL